MVYLTTLMGQLFRQYSAVPSATSSATHHPPSHRCQYSCTYMKGMRWLNNWSPDFEEFKFSAPPGLKQPCVTVSFCLCPSLPPRGRSYFIHVAWCPVNTNILGQKQGPVSWVTKKNNFSMTILSHTTLLTFNPLQGFREITALNNN
jgi:hypothetical protein